MEDNEFKEIENETEEIIESDVSEPKKNNEEEPKKVNWVKEVRDWIVAIAVAVALALLIRNFVFTLVNVKGASMEPSLHNNDRLYVTRLFYEPKRGDVVIFRPASDPKRPYVKRVIAVAGDTVYIDFKTGGVYVNDELIDEPYIKEKTRNTDSYINQLTKSGKYSRENPIVIQPGYIWCMGDNRNNSRDSRALGPIPEEELIGGALFRFWPLNNMGGIHQDAKEVSFDFELESGYMLS